MSLNEGLRPQMDTVEQMASAPDPEGREARWMRWVLQTARRWDDVVDVVRLTELEPIDEDHRHLAELTLSLSDILEVAARRGLSLEEISHQALTLDRLREAAARHFAREERSLHRFALPHAEEQLRSHAHFLDVLDTHIADFREGRLSSTSNMRGWILEWLITHANTLDHGSFRYENWTPEVLARAESWDDVAEIVHFTQIAHMDGEHRELIERILALATALDQAGDPRVVLADYDAFFTLVDRHCRDEEMVIWHYDLPERDRQEREHEEMRVLLSGWRDAIAAGQKPEPAAMKGRLLSWWLRHMNDVDGPSFSADALGATMLARAAEWGDFASIVEVIGHAGLDDDHAAIGETIIGLRKLVAEAPPLDALLAVFDALQERIAAHFQAEEQQFSGLDELSAKLHLEDHARLLSLVRNTREDFRFGRATLTEAIRRLLLQEWVGHINRFDRLAFAEGAAQ